MKKVSKNTVSVDFSDTESSGARTIPEDTYNLQISEFEQKDSQAGNPMIVFTHKVADGQYKGAKIWDNISLTPQALWRFRAMLESLGIEASKKVDVNLDGLKGKVFRASIILETYNGKERPRISEFLAPSSGSKSGGSSGSVIKKGSMVTFDNDGSEFSGKVVSLDGNTATVEVDGPDGLEEWELGLDELKAA